MQSGHTTDCSGNAQIQTWIDIGTSINQPTRESLLHNEVLDKWQDDVANPSGIAKFGQIQCIDKNRGWASGQHVGLPCLHNILHSMIMRIIIIIIIIQSQRPTPNTWGLCNFMVISIAFRFAIVKIKDAVGELSRPTSVRSRAQQSWNPTEPKGGPGQAPVNIRLWS